MTVLAVVRELGERERRVAIVPAELGRLRSHGVEVMVEPGAGLQAGYSDDDYRDAGATVGAYDAAPSPQLIAKVAAPTAAEVERLPSGSALISFLLPNQDDVVERLQARGVAAFSFNLVPRTSRAQVLDALSSQASVAGYQAVITGADRLGRMLPMVMSAAGTVPPARVLVIGAGVAGLQAVATARRLGAAVTAYDVRPEAAEEIRSLGATALELPLVAASGEGGYAAAQSADFTARQQELLTGELVRSDVVITTAAVPGRPAPKLITAALVEGMRSGSVIVDLAAGSGGNCELTVDGAEADHGGVLVVGAGDLAAAVPASASALYARNVTNLVALLVRDGELKPDFDDEVIAAMCVTPGVFK